MARLSTPSPLAAEAPTSCFCLLVFDLLPAARYGQGRGCAALDLKAREILHPALARCPLLAEQSCARALPSHGPRAGRNLSCQKARQTGGPRPPTEKGHHHSGGTTAA